MADNRIKYFRKKAGMNQRQLAEKIGTSCDRVSVWESGRHDPTLFMALCLARALNTTVEELFSP